VILPVYCALVVLQCSLKLAEFELERYIDDGA
jgi:hypothetical protein